MKLMTAFGLGAGGAAKTIGEGLDREETKKARIARAAQAQNSINAQFKLYGQKREDEINDQLQDLIGSYRGMKLSDPQIAGLIQGGNATLEEVQKYYNAASDAGQNFSSLLNTVYGDGLTAESFTEKDFNTATQGYLGARLGPNRTPFSSPITVEYSQQLRDIYKASKMPTDFDESIMNTLNLKQIIQERIGTPNELPDDKKRMKELTAHMKNTHRSKMAAEVATATPPKFETNDANGIRATFLATKKDAFMDFATTDITGAITTSLEGSFDKAMSAFENLIASETNYLQTFNPLTGNIQFNQYNLDRYNESARSLGRFVHQDYKSRLKSRLTNRESAGTYTKATIKQAIQSGSLKRGDVFTFTKDNGTSKKGIFRGPDNTTTLGFNAYDTRSIEAIQAPMLIRVKAGTDGTTYEMYSAGN
tara:strand:+ start:1053 stop:2315 length:1263 start_codon:yes stop_codon:yes gene_type:complete